jgi:hypothetical protein
MLGAAMPLASYPLFHNLGIDWGNTLLGFVSLVFLPIPYVLLLSTLSLFLPLSPFISISPPLAFIVLCWSIYETGRSTDDRWLLFKYGGRLRNISPMALHDDQLEAMREGKVEEEVTGASI